MKKVLTDSKTGKKMTILYDSQYLPAFGEDGVEYFIFTSNLTDYFGEARTDCTIVDIKNQLAIKPITLSNIKSPAYDIREPLRYLLDEEAFEKATSIEEYVKILRENGLITTNS